MKCGLLVATCIEIVYTGGPGEGIPKARPSQAKECPTDDSRHGFIGRQLVARLTCFPLAVAKDDARIRSTRYSPEYLMS